MARILNPYPYAVSYRRSPSQAQPVQEPVQETESLELQERRQFYSRLGKPELAERYGVFEVPEGLSVKSISETEKGLQVTFYDPVATSMYLEKGRESREFFTSIGYAKYGGKYAPFDIPEGHRVGEITETSEGLQVTFVDVEAEKQYHAERQRSVDFFQEIGYPQYGGKYDPFTIPKGHQVGEIKEVDSGLQVTFYDTASVEMQRQIMEMENPQIAGISRNYQQYLIQSGLAQQAKYAQPKTVVSTLPKSDYWTYTPSPSRPTYTSLDKALAIIPPAGYRVTNIQPSTVEMVGPLQQGQTRPEIQTVSYSLEPLSQKPITQQSMVEPTLTNFIANPVGVIGTVANLASIGAAKLEQTKGYETFGKFMSYEVSGIGEYVNQMTQAKNFVSPIIGAPSEPLPFTPKSETQEFGMKTARVAEAVTLAAVAPVVGPVVGIGAKAILINEVVGVGVTQAFKASQGGGLLTVEEVFQSAAISGVFTVASAGLFKGVGKVAPQIVESKIGRMSLYSALGAGGGYVLSGGSLEEAGKGALFGAALGLASELAPKMISVIKQRGQPEFHEEFTVGASGEKVRVLVSDPIKELGGKRVRIVGDVTEKPVGTQGVTRSSLIEEYVGKNVPTGHATLEGHKFNLKAGGETLLKGFPTKSKGDRKSLELFHFYSAPGTDDFITVYGGYAGIGKGYSGTPKIMFGGKPTALVTLDTQVSPEFLRLQGESQASYLARISSLSGKTGLAPETLLGRSMERQLITPASYERFGVQLPGSKFISEGKAVTLQIKTEPTGLLGRIPVLRTLFTDYTSIDIVKGRYAPATTATASAAKTLDVAQYSSSYGRILSLPKTVSTVSPSAIIRSESLAFSIGGESYFVSQSKTAKSQVQQTSKEYSAKTIDSKTSIPLEFIETPYSPIDSPSQFSSEYSEPYLSTKSGFSSRIDSDFINRELQISTFEETTSQKRLFEVSTSSISTASISSAKTSSSYLPRDTLQRDFFPVFKKTAMFRQRAKLSLWEFPIADPKQVAKRFNINQRLKKNEIW